MSFLVTNVICRFNSASGGPPRTIIGISRASIGYWRAELFTTDYTTGASDPLLIRQFNGHVNLLAASAQTATGGLLRMSRLFRSYEAQLLKGIGPNVVHLHGVWSPLLAAFASTAFRNRIPYIVAPHGMLEPWPLRDRGLRKAVALRTYQGSVLSHAAAVHATSELEAEHLRALPSVNCPVFVVPNFIEEPIGSSEPPLDESARKSGRRVLLFLSRIHEKKGLDMLLQVWNDLRPADWELRIVGNGVPTYVQSLKRYCEDQAVPNVSFHSHVDGEHREAMFARASAFVLPTYSENFGNVVAEALIRGLPVITTTGTPWVDVGRQKLGWYVEPKAESLRVALRELFANDPEMLRRMGERGRQYASSRFTIDAVRARLVEMYEGTIGRTSAADAVDMRAAQSGRRSAV